MAGRNHSNSIWRQYNAALPFPFMLTIITSLIATATPALAFQPTFASPPRRSPFNDNNESRHRYINNARLPRLTLTAAPEGALPDIVIPSIFNLSDWKDANEEDEGDPRIWVPQTDCLSFRPLCFCTSQGYYVNLLKFTGGGVLGRHRHSSPVHGLTLKGSWGYREHGWHAYPGTYIFEPPGETHTLVVDEDCEEMVILFHVTGSLLYMSEETGETTGFDDVFTKLEKARDWYQECGLGRDYADQFIR